MPQVFVQGQTLHTLDVSSETTVDVLKSALAAAEGIPAEEQVLTYGGVPLEDECVLADSVPELATLNVTVRVVGGTLKPDHRTVTVNFTLFSTHRTWTCCVASFSACSLFRSPQVKFTAPWLVPARSEDRRQRYVLRPGAVMVAIATLL